MLRLSTLSALVLLTALAGCSASTVPLRVDARHPASPHAPEGLQAPAWIGLQADEFDEAVAAAAAPAEAGADSDSAVPVHKGQAAPAHLRHDTGSKASAPNAVTPSRKPSASARARAQPAAIYACPMHLEVTGTTASECPKCGMKLVRRKEKP